MFSTQGLHVLLHLCQRMVKEKICICNCGPAPTMQPHHLIFLIRVRAKPTALFLNGAGTLSICCHPYPQQSGSSNSLLRETLWCKQGCPSEHKAAQPWGVELGARSQPFRPGGCINEIAKEGILKTPSSVLLSVQVPHCLPRVGVLEAAEESIPRVCSAVV